MDQAMSRPLRSKAIAMGQAASDTAFRVVGSRGWGFTRK